MLYTDDIYDNIILMTNETADQQQEAANATNNKAIWSIVLASFIGSLTSIFINPILGPTLAVCLFAYLDHKSRGSTVEKVASDQPRK